LSLRSNSGLKLANAFGVFVCDFKLTQYSAWHLSCASSISKANCDLE
jgi:hypothetical protein